MRVACPESLRGRLGYHRAVPPEQGTQTAIKLTLIGQVLGTHPSSGQRFGLVGYLRRSLLPDFLGQTPIQTKRGTLGSPWNRPQGGHEHEDEYAGQVLGTDPN